jgi:hypothetical protein
MEIVLDYGVYIRDPRTPHTYHSDSLSPPTNSLPGPIPFQRPSADYSQRHADHF